jgi:Domain of unknown function (DUF4389)
MSLVESLHPVRLLVNDDLRRSRLTVLVRVFLAIPHLVWFWVFSLAAFFVALANWFVTLITGRPQAAMHDFLARYARYSTHLSAYLGLVANPFPRFLGRPGSYPVDLELPAPERQERWTIAFRLVLAVPGLVFAYVFGAVIVVVALVGWFVALAIGRMPKGMRDLSAYCLRYRAQTLAYVILLTSRYPTLYAVPA